LLACNPPYGVRLSADVRALFRELEEAAGRRPGWRAAVLTPPGGFSRFPAVLRTQNGGIPVEVRVSRPR
jgi:23S rRNA G2445 N2-methylase RlmL